MHVTRTRIGIASLLTAAAAAWPTVHCALVYAMATPLQRALRASWCGGAPQDGFLAHHAPCWSGVAALLLLAAFAIGGSARQSHTGLIRL